MKIRIYILLCVAFIMVSAAMEKEQTKLPLPILKQEFNLRVPTTACFTKGGNLVIGSEQSFSEGKAFVYAKDSYTKPILSIPWNCNSSDPIAANPVAAEQIALGSITESSIWDIATGKKISTLPERAQNADCMEYSSDGKQLLLATVSGTVLVDLAANELMPVDERYSNNARYNPCEAHQITFTTDSQEDESDASLVCIFDLRARKSVHTIDPNLPVYCVKYNTNGTKLVGSAAHNMIVWDTQKGSVVEYLNIWGKKLEKPYPLRHDMGPMYAESITFIPP